MSKRTGGLQISYTIDEDSSDTDNADMVEVAKPSNATAVDSAKENAPKPKTKKGAAAGTKTNAKTGAKTKGRRKSGSPSAGVKKPVAPAKKGKGTGKAQRAPLKEIPNAQVGTEGNDEDELDDLNEDAKDPNTEAKDQDINALAGKEQEKKKKTADKSKKVEVKIPAKTAHGRGKRKSIDEIPETQQEPSAPSPPREAAQPVANKKPRTTKREAPVPETQVDPPDVDDSHITAEDETTPAPAKKPPAKKANSRAAPKSGARQQRAPSRQAEGKDASKEDDTDAVKLRRQLARVTKDFDSLNVQYKTLHEIGIKQAEKNYDQLKEASNERAKAAEDLIQCLRDEIKTIRSAASQVTTLKSENESLKAQFESRSSEIKSAQTSLTTAQNEIKALNAKLAVTRANSADLSNGKQPTSTAGQPPIKTGSNTVFVANTAAAKEDARKRVMKEELYGDLTGLIVRDIKKREEKRRETGSGLEKEVSEDVFDCIQTGRNGTLHFHLSTPNPLPPNTAYDDVDVSYIPLLDTSRDKDLLELLPDYLTEEICFPRRQMAMFYERIYKCMVKRPESVVDDAEVNDKNDAEEG